ncbi:MAG: biotin--[acetyl-CoA-carboxylase] ligase [Spirochaetaceae bacterium]|jgi:BirA family biotin operon repressor/biotin-[acetyl-CoA-carboxylase] ligase|nr:biotin--[acetyl-CoA-carboxylase] ligase [Spirochaetaceae bacterium]
MSSNRSGTVYNFEIDEKGDHFSIPDQETSGAVYRRVRIKNRDGSAEKICSAGVHFLGRDIQIVHTDKTGSTMTDARVFGALPEEHPWHLPTGSIVSAAFQNQGRGRTQGRSWSTAEGENLLCTAVLHTKDLPPRSVNAFTLKIGLAAAETFDHFLPGGVKTEIKWPNDVMFNGKKLCGILCESDGRTIYAGTGFNISQTEFPAPLSEKATSLSLILNNHTGGSFPPPDIIPRPFEFLAVYLEQLQNVLSREEWREEVESRLFRKEEDTVFIQGQPEKGTPLRGVIEGIGPSGELFFRHETGDLLTLVSGEFTL